MGFVPLLNRSGYTFYSGTLRVEEIPLLAARHGYGAVGLCDRDGLYASVRFTKACRAAGVRPLLGVEVSGLRGGPSLWAFARDAEGYGRLCALVTRRNLEPESFDLIAAGAAASVGGHAALLADSPDLLFALKKAGVQRGDLLARVGGRDRSADREVRAASEWLGLPLVAAPEAFFGGPDGYAVHRVLRAAKHRLPEAAPEEWLLAPGEARARFSREEAALDASGALADSCDVRLPVGEWLLPSPPLAPGETHEGHLRALAYAGLARRVRNVTAPYLRRLESELSTIVRLGFAGYFLVVEDLARFARARGIPNIGRGSGASSLVSYVLFLTHVDPVAEGLYFERFLNPERRNPPDIDLDFSWRERDQVIRHVYDTYGDDRVCMIGTHNTFSMRSGFREVGKALGVPEEELSVVARAVPHASAEGFEKALKARPESRGAGLSEGLWGDLLAVARWLDGLPRHLSVHCGGVVVSPAPLVQRLSLVRSARGVAITQADMFEVEELGLVKIDLLGNRSLGVLVDVVAAVEDHTGKAPPVVPPEKTYGDLKTLALLSEGRTMGCFYVESPGMRLLLRRLRTRTFRDLTAVSSIIRPGVSESGMMEAYVRRALGEEPPAYLHPALEPILRETFGVMVYQEDVIRAAHEVVGLSLGEADLLRRAMSGKYRSRAEMDSLTETFFAKGGARGLGAEVLEALWGQIRSFAGYAFCKAHSASFAQLSYQMAYLKAHHPAEFFAALVNNQGGFYGTAAYLEEARRWGLALLPPDVNRSEEEFSGRDRRLRGGFFTLRGVRRDTMDRLYEERGEGPFASLGDLVGRLHGRLDPAEAETLVRAGACDGFGLHRGFLLWLLRAHGDDPEALRMAEAAGEAQALGGHSGWPEGLVVFPRTAEGMELYDPSPPSRPLPGLAQALLWHRESGASGAAGRPLSLAELLAGERRSLGYCVTAHPLMPLLDWAGEHGYVPARELASRNGTRASVWGQVITYKRLATRRTHEGMAFATLEDPTGLTELIFFPRAYREYGGLITAGRPLVVEGKVEEDRGGLTVTVARARAIRGVCVPRAVEDRGEAEPAVRA